MVVISHRGNLTGPNPSNENSPDYIDSAAEKEFHVEVDVWAENDLLYLGHDSPQHIITIEWLLERKNFLWIHCKNIEALMHLLIFSELNVFGHSNDDYVLTSKHNIFCKPGIQINSSAVVVMPEMVPIYTEEALLNSYGILTDYPVEIREKNLNRFIT